MYGETKCRMRDEHRGVVSRADPVLDCDVDMKGARSLMSPRLEAP